MAPLGLAAIGERGARGEQALLLLNRRGWAPVLHCADCGWKSECPHCSAYRVFHKIDRTLRCHHCGFTQRVPRACPACGSLDIVPIGRGTEQLEEQLTQLLAPVRRPDGTPARVFNARGVEVRLPSRGQVRALMAGEAGALRRLGLPDSTAGGPAGEADDVGVAVRADDPLLGLLQDGRDRAARRSAIGRRLGAPLERVKGLDRHVVRSGDDTIETLVDPVTAVPVEVAVVRDGAVIERVRHAFATAPRGGLVRRGVQSERVLPGEGERLLVDVEFSGLRVEAGGER